jgi:hypothetical protein
LDFSEESLMQITINIPTKADIINGGFPVHVAKTGTEWKKAQLGDYADRRGVYIHHSNGRILYIGKATDGKYGTFCERLRREFQELASSNSALHKLLCSQQHQIRTYCLDLGDLDMMVDAGSMPCSPERKALIMEQVLIGVYEPEGNRT